MSINNIEQVKSLLRFDSPDDFYHLQILKRKKENPELGSNSYVIKTYYVTSAEYLEARMPEIISMCDFSNARACINLNRRSFEKMAYHTLKKITDQIMNRDFASARKAYESTCGAQMNELDKRWILDVDWVDWDLIDGWDDDQSALKIKRDQLINEIIADVQGCVADTGRDDTVWTLPTKNGMHIITRPFNSTAFFDNVWHKVAIQKNNPTILYMP